MGDTPHPEASLRPNPRQRGFAPLHTLAKCQCHSRGACPREDGERESRKRKPTRPAAQTAFQSSGLPLSSNLSLRGAEGDAAISGGWRLLRLLLATLGEWLAMTNDWGPVDDEGMDARPDEDDRGLKVRKRPSRRRFLSSNARHRPLSRWFRVSACSSPSVWIRTRRWNRAAQDGSSCHPLTSRTPGP